MLTLLHPYLRQQLTGAEEPHLFGVADLVQSCCRAVMGSRRAAFHAG
jgi:hypothetical protein